MTMMPNSEVTPSKPSVLTSTGIFIEKKRSTDKVLEKLAATALEKFSKAQNDRSKRERQWYLNLSFYFGHQYVKFRNIRGTNSFDLWVPPAPYYKVRPTINQVRKVVRKEMARLTAQQPNAYVVPASTEDSDVFAAQAAEQIWESLWRKVKFNRILRQAVFWQTVCGNGYIQQHWDPTKKDSFNNVDGDIVIRAETPFHILVPDLKEENIEEQPFVMHAQIRSREWVRNYLGVDPTDSKLNLVDEQLFNIMGINQLNKKESCIVLEFWVRPGIVSQLPNGGMFTVAANKVVQGFDYWPFSHNQYPFSKLDAIPTGQYYNDSILVDLIPLQRELNRTRGQIIEAKNRMAKPQLVAEKGSIDPSKITSEPGQVIQYKMGYSKPEPLPLQNLPSYVTEEINRLYADIADLSGQHEVTQGQVPPGLTAATAISFLQEQDETLISSHFDSVEEAVEKTAFQCLNYAKDFWDEPRSIKVVGIDRTFDVQTFRGSQLGDNTDIRIEGGSALPTSRAAKQAYITDLMKMNFIDPQDGLEVLEIGGLNRIYEKVQVDKRQAQRENLKMRVVTEDNIKQFNEAWTQNQQTLQQDQEAGLQLIPPLIIPTNTWDNHAIHIEEHNRYRKSQSFEMAPPIVKMLFEEHVRQHQEALVVQMPNPMMPPAEEGQIEEEQQPPGPEPLPEGV